MVPAGSVAAHGSVATADDDPIQSALASPTFANPHAAPAVKTFEAVLGGRSALAEELLTSPELTPRIQRVLTLILDPRFDKYPLAYLCEKAGVLPGDLFASFRDATLAKANLLALRVAADKLPGMLAEMMRDAVDREIVCPECQGLRVTTPEPTDAQKNPTPERCRSCFGHGVTILKADRAVQKIALELTGLLRKNGGITVQQTNQTLQVNDPPVTTGAGGLAQLQQAVSGILFGGPLRPAAPPAVIDLSPSEDPTA